MALKITGVNKRIEELWDAVCVARPGLKQARFAEEHHADGLRQQKKTLLSLTLASALTACTTVDTLKPGVDRGTREHGFMKTTEGLALAIPNRSYAEVWAAAEKAVRAQLTLVTADPARGILRAADVNFLGLDKCYVGVFITPATPGAPAYTVEVSQILKNRTSIDVLGLMQFETTILRAIQADVGGA